MSHIIAFLLGAILGFLGSWFVWKNNKKKWASVEGKYDKAISLIKDNKDA